MATATSPIDSAVTAKGRERLQHVVVLMLENRSFDHMLGFLKHPNPEYSPPPTDFYNWDVVPGGTKTFATPNGEPLGVDPDHSHGGIGAQVGELGDVATMGGFVSNYALRDKLHAARVMECLDPEVQCPMLAFLAKNFAVCTNWHASVP